MAAIPAARSTVLAWDSSWSCLPSGELLTTVDAWSVSLYSFVAFVAALVTRGRYYDVKGKLAPLLKY